MRTAVIAALLFAPLLQSAEEKLQFPTAAQSAKARLAIADSLGGEIERAKTPAVRKALAAKMLALANDSKETPPNRWVLFTRAVDMAASAGDAPTAIKAFRDSAKTFDFVSFHTAADLAEQLVKMAIPSKSLIDFAISSAEDSVVADYYPEAKRLFAVALYAAKSGKDFSSIERIKIRARYAAELAKEYEAANGEAEAMGRFQAFRKNDWAKGLPLLVKSKQEGLAAVAKKDAGNPAEAKDRVDLGDCWYDLGGQTKGEDRLGMLRRAMGWYRQGVVGLGGLARAKVEGRMQRVFDEIEIEDVKAGLFTMWVGKWTVTYNPPFIHEYRITNDGRIYWTKRTTPEGQNNTYEEASPNYLKKVKAGLVGSFDGQHLVERFQISGWSGVSTERFHPPFSSSKPDLLGTGKWAP